MHVWKCVALNSRNEEELSHFFSFLDGFLIVQPHVRNMNRNGRNLKRANSDLPEIEIFLRSKFITIS